MALAGDAIGLEQMSLNNKHSKGGLPVTSDNFLVYVTEWMVNIANSTANTSQPITFKSQPQTLDTSASASKLSKACLFKQIKDKVFPTLEEINFCIRKKLVSQKEHILYKLIIDLNEAQCNS